MLDRALPPHTILVRDIHIYVHKSIHTSHFSKLFTLGTPHDPAGWRGWGGGRTPQEPSPAQPSHAARGAI